MAEEQKYTRSWWSNQLIKDEKRLKDDWWTSADQIVKKYKSKKPADGDTTYLYNVFWANVGVLKAALFARPPKPMVSRIWADQGDNIARVAALILQRCLAYDFIKNDSPMTEAIKLAVEDRLIPGAGLIWLRYEVETEEVSVPGAGEGDEPVKMVLIKEEEVPCDYVHWRDIIFPSARTANELWYVARKIYMPVEEFEKKFNVKMGRSDGAASNDPDKVLPKNFARGKVCVNEIWCKKSNHVYWTCNEKSDFFKSKEDFLKLDGFYPCPSLLMATHTTDDYLPRPDYTMMRDQYDEITELNTRITILEKALRVVGVYDKKNAEVQRILSESRENDMIPVEKWAVLAEQGGLKGVVDWFPIDVVAGVLEKLQEQFQMKLQQLFELSGISDIMRGTTNARETLGAQELKSQYSSVRLQYVQGEVSTFVRQALIVKSQIICQHCQPETIKKWSNIMSTPDAQYADQAIGLLQSSEISEYKIDINEEGLALPDYNQEKQIRIEFLTTIGQFLSQAAPITTAIPEALPYLVQMIRWVAAGLRGSDEIQGVLDQAIAQLQANPGIGKQQQKPAQESKLPIEQMKQQGETQRAQMKLGAEAQNTVMQAKIDAGLNKQSHDLQLRNEQVMEKIKAGHDASMVVREAMNDQAQAHHDFVRSLLTQRKDHEHELELQASAPKPTAS